MKEECEIEEYHCIACTSECTEREESYNPNWREELDYWQMVRDYQHSVLEFKE